MAFYKVVRRRTEYLITSAVISGAGIVIYSTDKPPMIPAFLSELGYYPLAFMTIEDCKAFIEKVKDAYAKIQEPIDGLEIWEVTGQRVDMPPFLSPIAVSRGNIIRRPEGDYQPNSVMLKNPILRNRIE